MHYYEALWGFFPPIWRNTCIVEDLAQFLCTLINTQLRFKLQGLGGGKDSSRYVRQLWRFKAKGTSVVFASRQCSCPAAAGSGLPFPTDEQSRPIRPGVRGARLTLWGLWGGARPSGGGDGRQGWGLGWAQLFKQGSALCVGGRSVGEEQMRGLPKASVRPCCLVCQTWLDLAGARPARCEGWGLAGGAEPDPPFMCCWKVSFVVGLAVFVPFWKQCPFLRASASERGEQPRPFVSNLSSAFCQCLGVALTPPGLERSIFPAGLELLIWNWIRPGSSKVLSYFKSGLPPPPGPSPVFSTLCERFRTPGNRNSNKICSSRPFCRHVPHRLNYLHSAISHREIKALLLQY